MKIEGVWPAIITPFYKHQMVAFQALKKHIEFLFEAQVDGLVVCGTTGEAPTLTREERREILKTCISIANTYNKKIIAGCGGNATQEVLNLINESKELGCLAALVTTPYYNKPTQKGLQAHYEYLADKSQFPILLYNVPSRTGVNLKPQTALSLLEHPYIIGIKEASPSYQQWLELCSSIENQKVSLLSGEDSNFALFLSLGGCGIISASANVVPELFVQIYHLFKQKRWPEMFDLQKKLTPLIRALFMETNPAPVKKALEMVYGLPATLRLPLVEPSEATVEALKKALKDLGYLK